MAEFRNFKEEDYQAVCVFLKELNQADKKHINWNWARFEWMYEHPEFDKSAIGSIGLWYEHGKVVAAALYDMYFGEGFCGVLPGYMDLYGEVLTYACEHLRDESGFGFAIEDNDIEKIKAAEALGFSKADQTENIMSCSLNGKRAYTLETGLSIKEFDPGKNPYEFAWLLWQGFDHGQDKDEFEKSDEKKPQIRPNLKKELSLTAVNEKGDAVSYVCLWKDEETDYAYIEPVCTIPEYRGKGVAKSLLYEAFNRALDLGAKNAYVISDMDFYKRLDMDTDRHFTFYWKE